MDAKEIEWEAARVLDRLPVYFRRRLQNVEIVVKKKPKRSDLIALGLDPRRQTLYGLYQGTPLPDRSVLYPPLLPDRITIFSGPLLKDFPNPNELREQIRLTILHELAHYFGISEKEIEKFGY